MNTKPETNDKFSSYANTQRTLIADSGQTSRAVIASQLSSMGILTSRMLLASTFDEAAEQIRSQKPKIVIADYDLGKGQGLELLQRLRQEWPDAKDLIFILVTGNSSQSAVARAAEEDVDAFLLKPFTSEVLRNTILRAALTKINPPRYLQLIDEGKKKLHENNLEEALKIFEEASKEDAQPSLALAYIGQVKLLENVFDEAEGKFSDGLGFNKIHYRCLVGLYETFMSQKRHAEAYEIIKRVSQYFPANPQRLTAVLRLAIINKSYEDVEKYYRIFTEIETRNEEMVRYICAALVVCGKHYLATRLKSRAIELFQKAAATSGGRPKIMREIVLALLEFGSARDASEFLKKVPPETRTSPDYIVSDIAVRDGLDIDPLVLDQARRLIQGGLHDAILYKVAIRRSFAAKHADAAENLLLDAEKRFPESSSLWAELKSLK